MTILQLLEAVGIENVRVQYLHDTATGATYKQKQGATEFRFRTCEGEVNDLLPHGQRVAMIVWMPRYKFEAACKAYLVKEAPAP